MSEEERKAIEDFKYGIDNPTFNYGKGCIVKVESVETVLNLIEKKDKIIDEIQKEVRDHIGFENRLKRDNKEPDLFNQGRFYVANNINNILKGKVENGN